MATAKAENGKLKRAGEGPGPFLPKGCFFLSGKDEQAGREGRGVQSLGSGIHIGGGSSTGRLCWRHLRLAPLCL